MVYRTTGLDLGFAERPTDKDFIFQVQLATYANERQAQPLIDIAMDQLKTKLQREQALQALLRFPSNSDWIRPFLNDIPKGGMVGLYDEESPVLDSVVRQIRLEGGIQKPLIRAYAEVSLSFMLQVPEDIIRRKTLGWISDILPEEALFLIVTRIDREKEPLVQKKIDEALWDVRAVSNKPKARDLLVPIYRQPPWPSIKTPVAVILARLGDAGAVGYLQNVLNSRSLDESHETIVRVAMARTPYPTQILPSEQIQTAWKNHEEASRKQYQAALQKQRQIVREERIAAHVEQKVESHEKPTVVAMVPPTAPPPPVPVAQPRVEAPATKPPVKEDVIEKPAKAVAPVPPVPVEEEKPVVETPPVVEEVPVPKAPESNMRYVDMIFEVKDAPAPLYANAGDEKASDIVLDVGTKGKATFEVIINDEKWFQVKARHKTGWARGDSLKIYDLAPTAEAAQAPVAPPPVEKAERSEATYFEVVDEGITAREKPNDKSAGVMALETGKPYLATKSEKIGPDRWFLLTLSNGKQGWVAGTDLQLADVPEAMKTEQKLTQQTEPKSAFAAEWVVPSVEGVLVYERPSIAGKVVKKISPPVIFKVVDTSAGAGEEWYKIRLSEKKDLSGWVQAMDVSLTKP
jgi:hypothetical protein